MQEISPVTPTELLAPTKELLYRFEIYDGASWIDLCNLGGKNYLMDKSMRVELSGPGRTPEPIAGKWSASILNKDGIFDPFHPTSEYAGLFRIGRKVRLSLGGVYDGEPLYWARLIGYMDAPEFDDESHSIKLSGLDFTKRLADTKLYKPNNYWGRIETLSSVSSFTETGAQLYDKADAMDIDSEADDISTDWGLNGVTFTSEGPPPDIPAGGDGDYAGEMMTTADSGNAIAVIASVSADTRYVLKVKYYRQNGHITKFEVANGGEWKYAFTDDSVPDATWHTWTQEMDNLTAGNLWLRISMSSAAGAVLWITSISLKACDKNWNKYQMPSTCNGPHYVTLDGDAVNYGDPVGRDGSGGGWYYDEPTKMFYFDEHKTVEEGTDNLLIYYYETQIVEDAVAGLLVRAGLYAGQATALAAMDYVPTGVTIPRVWFESGASALEAVRMLCERVDYRFWFAYDGTPCFNPAPEATEPVFEFSSYGHIKAPRRRQEVAQIRNRVVVEGAERAMFKARDDKDRSRWIGAAHDQDSIDGFGEFTESVSNHLFQNQDSVDSMAPVILAGRKDPKWYIELRLAGNPVPLELGDTVSMTVHLDLLPTVMNVTALIRDMTIDGSSINYTCEVTGWEEGEPPGHMLLDGAVHYDTVPGEAEAGALIVGAGNPEIPLGSPGPDQHALLNGSMHPDTEEQEPELGGLIVGLGSDPVRWSKLAAGEEGRMLEMGATAPAWGRKIHSADDAPEPEEGADGDIWFEY